MESSPTEQELSNKVTQRAKKKDTHWEEFEPIEKYVYHGNYFAQRQENNIKILIHNEINSSNSLSISKWSFIVTLHSKQKLNNYFPLWLYNVTESVSFENYA